MPRRNLPNINPNGARWRGVRVHKLSNHFDTTLSPVDRARMGKEYRSVMCLVAAYIDAGFTVKYSERLQPYSPSHRIKETPITVADIDCIPPEN